MFSDTKATALAHCFLSKTQDGKLNDLKLMKLMYMAERESLAQFSATITGSRFCSMMHGPVLSDAYSVMNEKVESAFWSDHVRFLRYRKGEAKENTFEKIRELDVSAYLSQAEIEIADQVWADYGENIKWDLVELTHTFPEWDPDAKINKTSYVLPVRTIFQKGFHKSPEEAEALEEAYHYYSAVAE